MKLSHFPPEILGHMLSSSDSSCLSIRLWKTGDRILQLRLAASELSLYLRPSHTQFQIPSIVAKLPRIRHFALEWRSMPNKETPQSIAMLEMLPRTMESLTLKVHRIHHFLTNHDLSSDVASLIPIETRYPQCVSRYIDLNALFPRLTTLTLRSVEIHVITPLICSLYCHQPSLN